MNQQILFKNFIITRRQFLLSAFQFGLLTAITLRIGYLQLLSHEKYSLMSKNNSIRTIVIAPIRGTIVDRNNKELAVNKQQFKLTLHRPLSKKSKQTLAKIVQILELNTLEQEQIRSKINQKPFKTTILENLTWSQILALEQNIFTLDNVFIDNYFVRVYPYAQILAHPIGYSAASNQKEAQLLGLTRLENSSVGKTGIEKYYNNQLIGSIGFKEMEVDAHGNHLRELDFVASQKGSSIKLSLDCTLQEEICKMLAGTSSAAVVYDLKLGQLLALTSLPNFYTDQFATGISKTYWQELNQDEKLPLLNKAVQGVYPPGSIFKLVTCLAALEKGIDPYHRLTCSAGSFFGSHFHCWNQSGHGPLNMIEAIGCSCNYYMYQIAKMIGAKAIIQTARKLGFGRPVGIDLHEEVSGFLPDLHGAKTLDFASTLNLSIGQGPVTTTPLQLNKLVSLIAGKGLIGNYCIAGGLQQPVEKVDIKSENFAIIEQGMWRAVNHIAGTCYLSKSSLTTIAAKTGTAQVQSKKHKSQDFNKKSTPWHQRNHALCVGFAPFVEPRYCAAVVIEHGGGGGKNAAPVIKKIIDLLIKEKST